MAIFLIHWLSKAVCRSNFNTLVRSFSLNTLQLWSWKRNKTICNRWWLLFFCSPWCCWNRKTETKGLMELNTPTSDADGITGWSTPCMHRCFNNPKWPLISKPWRMLYCLYSGMFRSYSKSCWIFFILRWHFIQTVFFAFCKSLLCDAGGLLLLAFFHLRLIIDTQLSVKVSNSGRSYPDYKIFLSSNVPQNS